MKLQRLFSIVLVLACICDLTASGQALAATTPPPQITVPDRTLDLITSPLPINLVTTPGKPVTTDLRIKNGSTYPEDLKVNLMKFSAYGELGKPAIQDGTPADEFLSWASFSQTTFTAPPDQWVTLKMTINVPPKAAFGYYYAVVFSRANQPTKPKPGQNVLVGSTAVLVLLDVEAPGAVRRAEISDYSVDRHIFEYLPATFSVKVHNTGNIHVAPTGSIYIKRGKTTVATLPINSSSGNVLPGSNRVFTAAWKDGFPAYVEKEAGGQVILDAHDKPVRYLQWDMSKVSRLRIGHYTADVLMAYDNGKTDEPIEATLSFWVIPWRLILTVIAIPVVPALLAYLIASRRYKRRLRKQHDSEKSKASSQD